ncbi:MAG TPA: polysaccharide deacetylase family protein [Candidatus Acidoferrales bacterium]|jgi:peptidoglycan/xylan/chitin deacetylase (PgdA/CDA1 family)|nr:polysaccharide deacetylase family protein [Candidatus Acidoferrales bacterium]
MNLASIAALAAAAGGAASCAWGAVHPRSQLFGRTLCRTGDDSTLALTFDDGPNPAVTPRLLELLARHEARATFFLIGRYVRACPGLAAEIAARGHVIGNHTETHPNLIWLSPQRIREELMQCGEAIAEATGRKAGWMRPPFGYRGPQLGGAVRGAACAGVAMWSASGRDWRPQPAARVIRRLRRARGGDIVLLHDGDYRALGADRRHTIEALEYWLPRWKDAGLCFVGLDASQNHGKGQANG